MAEAAEPMLDMGVDRASCLGFDGPAGRTELIRGRRRAGVETVVCSADHVVLARFGGRSAQVCLHVAHGPQWWGPAPARLVAVLPANRRLVCSDAGADDVECLAVFLPPRILDECAAPPGGVVELRARLGAADAEIWATLCKIKRAVERPHSLWPSYHGQLLRLLAAELASRHARPLAALPTGAACRGGLSGRHARLVKEHLAEHFARTVPLAELAALVRLNRSHLCEAFRQSTGLAPHQFQTARRIDRAKELLAEGALPLAEIALAVGYSDQSQFGAMFRKATGSSPGRFRKQALAQATVAGARAAAASCTAAPGCDGPMPAAAMACRS